MRLPQARQASPALPGPRQDGGLSGDHRDHELDAWCDTCDDFHQPHKSPTSSSASFDDQLWSQTPL